MSTITYETVRAVPLSELLSLYGSVGWTSYTDLGDRLATTVSQSSLTVTARSGDSLIGLVRCLSDDVSVVLVQDILVRPEHQGQGIGRALMTQVLERYPHVRQKLLLTDDRPEQQAFYAAMGFSDTRSLTRAPLRAFVRYEGLTLE